jgi:hypothetical protein
MHEWRIDSRIIAAVRSVYTHLVVVLCSGQGVGVWEGGHGQISVRKAGSDQAHLQSITTHSFETDRTVLM